MKYFTPERYLALQNPETQAMDAADAAWDEAVEQYESYLQSIHTRLPESVRQLLDDFYFPDAEVLAMSRKDGDFVVTLQLDVPPHDLLTITYALNGPAELIKDKLPSEYISSRPQWLHDELTLIGREENQSFAHAILLSNGWELRVPFREVRLTTATPVFPLPRSRQEPPHAPASQSA
jgi:hypothetical protein